MKKSFTILIIVIVLVSCKNSDKTKHSEINPVITKEELKDKIKGGWAGQVIGCTFGGPTEFKFNGTMIQDYHPIPWNESSCLWYYENAPGLYDDIYMDLTFVDIFEKEGLDAPASAHALAFANADYKLWHANQAARYNILNGIMPPESGYWTNNPHSEDIDFQIEADFAGLMSPGMVNTASEFCDKVGHIMNYGDGWYGGVYVAAMYSLAFISNDINYIVEEGLKSIPEESEFHKCIADVIKWHKQYPDDWKQTWFEVEKKWSSDIGCPSGVFRAFNIDAKVNAAYIVIGLLYGEGDYTKTLEISTRCGQDSDCNPASAGGILGTMMGYSKIPEYWKKPLYVVEDMDFKYTTISLNDVYETGTKQALQVLEKNGANVNTPEIEIPIQEIKPVELEIGFKGHYPVERKRIGKNLSVNKPELEFKFKGIGFVLKGVVAKPKFREAEDVDFELETWVDGKLVESFKMPSGSKDRRHDITWRYELEEGEHTVKVKLLNPKEDYKIWAEDLIVYGSSANSNAKVAEK